MFARSVRTLAALCLAAVFAGPLPAEIRGDAGSFLALEKEHRELVLGQLQQLLSASIDRAKQTIRDTGELRPFAYVGDFEATGRYVRLGEDQTVRPEVALIAIQRAVVKAAVDGTLAASLLYVSAKDSGQLTDELKQRFASSLSAQDMELDDVRFLLIEMQHVAGLGILQVIPYWRSGSGWEVGSALQQTIEPRLHQVVRAQTARPDEQS